MKKILLVICMSTLIFTLTGCYDNGKGLLEKDMYLVGEKVTIDLNKSEIEDRSMVDYINVYKYETKNYKQIESVELNEKVFTYTFSKPGGYKLVWMEASSKLGIHDVVFYITVK